MEQSVSVKAKKVLQYWYENLVIHHYISLRTTSNCLTFRFEKEWTDYFAHRNCSLRVNIVEWNGFSCLCFQFNKPHYQRFCLFTWPLRRKCSSSDNKKFWKDGNHVVGRVDFWASSVSCKSCIVTCLFTKWEFRCLANWLVHTFQIFLNDIDHCQSWTSVPMFSQSFGTPCIFYIYTHVKYSA